MALWQAGKDYPFYGYSGWPVRVAPLSHQQLRELGDVTAATTDAAPIPALDFVSDPAAASVLPELNLTNDTTAHVSSPADFAEAPPVAANFFASVGPEVAERWLDRSQDDAIFTPVALAMPGLSLAADLTATPELESLQPVPAPEPVAVWIAVSAAVEPVYAEIAWPIALPALPGLEVEVDAIPDIAAFQLVPAAEPAAAWLNIIDAASPILTALSAPLPAPLSSVVPAVELPESVESPHLQADLVTSAAALTLAAPAVSVAVPALPGFTIAAELDPLPEIDEFFEPPALSEVFIAGPAAEPVWNFLQTASAAEIVTELPQAAPVFAGEIGSTYIPVAQRTRPVPQAEPVMAGVWPRIAETPIESIDSVPVFQLPALVAGPDALRTPFADAATLPAAEPVESFMVASHAVEFIAFDTAAMSLHMPSMAALEVVGPARATARHTVAEQPEAVASWIDTAAASEALAEMPLALQPFQLEPHSSAVVPVSGHPPLEASVAEPAPAEGKQLELHPLPTVTLALPEPQHHRPLPAIPTPGVVAIEYHMQRTRSDVYERPEWKTSRYEPLAPAFSLSPALENLGDLVKPKPEFGGVFQISGRSSHTRSAIMEHVLRVAAAIMVVTSMWVGGVALKSARRVTVRQQETAFATPDRVLTPSEQAAKTKPNESKGPLAWASKAIANRASVQVAEDFQGSMQKWGAAAGTMPANWRRDPAGYVQTGALALLNPTRTFTDYKLEFFGQIESKSMGWVVRAKDDKNYHAMKFSLVEKGLRPVIAIVHYNVIDGKVGKTISTPLNVMVHNNRPLQVAVTVKGKNFTTQVDGEEVDSYKEDLLPAGAVGFFSDAGERARLYWARVTKNDDWIGHFCAFLSGGESQSTAEVWPRSVPGVPTPWDPTGDSSVLTAAWIGLPSFRRNSSSRRHKRCTR